MLFDQLRSGKPVIMKKSWIEHWNNNIDKDDTESRLLGLDIWNAFDVNADNKMDVC